MAEYTHIDRQEVNSPSSTGNAKKSCSPMRTVHELI